MPNYDAVFVMKLSVSDAVIKRGENFVGYIHEGDSFVSSGSYDTA